MSEREQPRLREAWGRLAVGLGGVARRWPSQGVSRRCIRHGGGRKDGGRRWWWW